MAFYWDWLTAIKLGLGIFGVAGNLLVIVVYISKTKRQNTTNSLILALAFTDLFTSANIIPWPTGLETVPQGALGQLYCSFIFANFFMWTSIVASVGILTTLSVERYLAVCRPQYYRRVFCRPRSRYIVAGIWVIAAVEKSFNLYCTVRTSEGTCEFIVPGNGGFQKFLAVGVFTFEYLLPLIVMVVTYIKTVHALKRQACNLLQQINSRNNPAYSLLETRRKVIEMLLLVIVAFVVCWGPLQFAFLIGSLVVSSDVYFFSALQDSFTVLAFFNSCANPLIYTFKNKHFRNSLRNRLCRRRDNAVNNSVVTVSVAPENETKHEISTLGSRVCGVPINSQANLPVIE